MNKYPKKLVAVMNDSISTGRIMNALAQMSIGLGAVIENKEDLRLVDYIDANNNSHPHISELPFIILRATADQIRQLRNDLRQKNLKFVDFPDFLNVIGTFDSPEKSKEFKEENIKYYGIVMFDDWDIISELTKKFVLWK